MRTDQFIYGWVLPLRACPLVPVPGGDDNER
jgi:hypothetical protein